MSALANFGRYLWRFFVGDSFQLGGLVVSFVIVAILAHPLKAWDGVVAFVLVSAVVVLDARQWAAKLRAQAKG